jgi:hypothetical protein
LDVMKNAVFGTRGKPSLHAVGAFLFTAKPSADVRSLARLSPGSG